MATNETSQQLWDRCLAQGTKYENKFIEYLNCDSYEFAEKGCKEYDIKTITNGIELYYEVKSDNISYKSGNMCIEYMHKGEPSGLNITIADYWVNFSLIDDDKYILYVIPVIELKNLIIEHKKNIKDIKGGYNRHASLYLISLSILDKYILRNKKI